MTEYRTLLSNFVKKSQINGLLKNDGTVDTTSYISTSNTQGLLKNDGTVDTTSYISTSNTQGLLKNDGTVDTTSYLSTHQDITGKEDKSNKVTSWSNTTTDAHYPSEKLVQDSLDGKIDKNQKSITTFTLENYVGNNDNATWNEGYTSVQIGVAGGTYFNFNNENAQNGDYITFIITNQSSTNDITLDSPTTANTPLSYTLSANSKVKIKVEYDDNLTISYINPDTDEVITSTSFGGIFGLYNGNSTTTQCIVGSRQHYHEVSFIDIIYPIGAIYLSTNSINPSLFIGGTWEQIQDRFLLGAGSTYSIGSTGGSATVTLTSAQSGVPAHSHKYNDYNTTYTLKTTNRKPGTSTAVAYGTSLTAGGGATERTSSNNTAANASQAHENMPPYLTVYMWKRTA